jgi:hypothetical protein
MEDFYKQKIVWKAVGRNLTFSLLEEGSFITAPASFITSDCYNLYILGFLCSSYAKYFIYNNSDTTGAGDIMLNIQSLERLPIPIVSNNDIINIVNEILVNKKRNINIDSMEKKLDLLIYKIFGFNSEEIKFIEGASR